MLILASSFCASSSAASLAKSCAISRCSGRMNCSACVWREGEKCARAARGNGHGAARTPVLLQPVRPCWQVPQAHAGGWGGEEGMFPPAAAGAHVRFPQCPHPSCLPRDLPAPAGAHHCLLPRYLPTCYLPTSLPAYPATCLPRYLPTCRRRPMAWSRSRSAASTPKVRSNSLVSRYFSRPCTGAFGARMVAGVLLQGRRPRLAHLTAQSSSLAW